MTKAISVQCKAISKQTGSSANARRSLVGRYVAITVEALSSESQGSRPSGAARLGSRRRHRRPGRSPAPARHPERRSSRALRHLLEEAYEAAERLKQAHDAGAEIEAPGNELADTAETARRDLDRIFNTGGVAALVGNTYGAAKDVGVYVTGEAIRGLADLEAKERERCANFATKAVAAGLAERTVRIAERQGQLMVEMVQAALREVDLSPEQASAFKAALARQARELTASGLKRPGEHPFLYTPSLSHGLRTSTPRHLEQLPRQASGYHAAGLFVSLETDLSGTTGTSEWSVFADLLDRPANLQVSGPVDAVAIALVQFLWSKQRQILRSSHFVIVTSRGRSGGTIPVARLARWVEERKLRWGVTSPIYQSKVLGEFPISR